MTTLVDEQQDPNKDTRVYYTIRQVQKLDRKPDETTDHYQEFVNHYKTQDEVMERFAYWSERANTMLVQVIVTVATSEIVAEWRSNEITIPNEHPSDGNADGGDVLSGSDQTDKETVG